jgi:small subunit ribosomal protein S6
MNKYEVMAVVKPDLSDEEKKVLFKQIDDAVIKYKGEISQSGVWAEKRKLCFPIGKFGEGVYYLVAFTAPSSAIKEIRNTYKLNESILRVLVTLMS